MFKIYTKKLALMASAFFFILFSFISSAIAKVPDEQNKKAILNKFKTLQIPFIENKGQIKDKKVSYYAKTMGGTFFITKDGKMVYSLPFYDNSQSESKTPKSILTNPKTKIQNQKQKGWVIKESLVGTLISNVKGEEKAITKVNYFKGKDSKQGVKTRKGSGLLLTYVSQTMEFGFENDQTFPLGFIDQFDVLLKSYS